MKKLDLKTVINTACLTGVLNHEQEVFLKKQQYGNALYNAALSRWFFVERVETIVKDLTMASYNLEAILFALDVKENIKDLTPLEALPINRIKAHEVNEKRLNFVQKSIARTLNDVVMICGYDCLTKALYEATQNDLIKKLFVGVTTTPEARKTDYKGMYFSDHFSLNTIEDCLQFLTAQMTELNKRIKTPFIMYNYKGYIPNRPVIKEAVLDVALQDDPLIATPHSYIEHIRQRYTRDSDRYMAMYGLNQWIEFTTHI